MPPFNPTPETTAQVLERFISAEYSLIEIAAEFGTNIVALCEWANRPDIRRALDAFEAELHAKVRAAAQAALPLALATLAMLDAEYPRPVRKRRKGRRAEEGAAGARPAEGPAAGVVASYTVYGFRLPYPRPGTVVGN